MLKCVSSGRRLAEPDSIRETRNCAMPRIGGPRDLEGSFWCPDWHPDHYSQRSRDEREDGLASQSGSHDEEVQDSPEGVRSDLPNSSNSFRAQRSTPPTSQTPERDEHDENRETDAGQRLKETNAGQLKKRPDNNNQLRVPDFALDLIYDIAPGGRSQTSVPANTIIRPELVVMGSYSRLFQQGGAAVRSLLSRGIHNRTPEPGVPSPYALPPEDTQDTRNSTQASNDSSQPAHFEHPTPPTQEPTGDFSSQMDTSDLDDGVGSIDTDMTDASQSPPGSTVRAPTLGKRRRDLYDTSGDRPRATRLLFREPKHPLFKEPKPRLFREPQRPLFRKRKLP